MRDFPEKYKAAVSAYLSLTEEQREVADEFHELGCSGHALNLIVEDSWKQSEKQALSKNMANHGTQAEENRNGSSELPDTSNVVNCTSKAIFVVRKALGLLPQRVLARRKVHPRK